MLGDEVAEWIRRRLQLSPSPVRTRPQAVIFTAES